MMSDCSECRENLSRSPIIPDVFQISVSDQVRAETMKQMHDMAAREGISHVEAGARMFVGGIRRLRAMEPTVDAHPIGWLEAKIKAADDE